MPLAAQTVDTHATAAGQASTQAAVDAIITFVNGLETSLGTTNGNVTTTTARATNVRAALLAVLTETRALLPAIIARLEPMADTAPLLEALDDAVTAVTAA